MLNRNSSQYVAVPYNDLLAWGCTFLCDKKDYNYAVDAYFRPIYMHIPFNRDRFCTSRIAIPCRFTWYFLNWTGIFRI